MTIVCDSSDEEEMVEIPDQQKGTYRYKRGREKKVSQKKTETYSQENKQAAKERYQNLLDKQRNKYGEFTAGRMTDASSSSAAVHRAHSPAEASAAASQAACQADDSQSLADLDEASTLPASSPPARHLRVKPLCHPDYYSELNPPSSLHPKPSPPGATARKF